MLEKASNPPGSKSPLIFDTYTLNHAAFVGMNEVINSSNNQFRQVRINVKVAWMNDFEQELTRRKVFVQPGSAAFNHFSFFKSKRSARRMSDDSSISIFGTQSLAKRLFLDTSIDQLVIYMYNMSLI